MKPLVLLRPLTFSSPSQYHLECKLRHKNPRFRVNCSPIRSPSINAKSTDSKSEYRAGVFDYLFLTLFRNKMVEEVGWDSEKPGYDGLIEVAHRLMTKGRSNSETEAAAVRILRSLFPPFLLELFKVLVAPIGRGKVAAIMVARVTAVSCQWLMGPCTVNSIELPNGSSWRSGVLVERCKYLEESKCVGICVNTCKLPTQTFFKDYMGVPLMMEPNFSDYSCQLKFGVLPPKLEEDKILSEPCLEICPKASRRREVRGNTDEIQCPKRRMEDINGDASQHNNGGDHVSIEIGQLNKTLASSIKAKLDNVSPSPFGRCCCVYRVHEKFRKINEYAYTPEMFSIGPFHREKGSLQAMEEHKLRYICALPEAKLLECVEALRRLEDEARKCYSEPINLDSDGFVEMMLVDGLFISQLFRKSVGEVKIDRNDPILNNSWGTASLVRDMILLENQIPMCVLKRIFDITAVNQGGSSLTKLALRFFNDLMPRNEEVLDKYSSYEGKHLLDLLGKTLHVSPRVVKTNSKKKWEFLPCVTELRRAGVKFKKGSSTGSFLDIKFSDGVLEIPPVLIQDQTDSLLRNLIASEQSCDGRATYMTSYAFLMDSLINSPDDVGFLRHHEILTNYLGDDEDVSNLFNKLCREVTLVNFYYSDLCEQVNSYYKIRWHVWRATLKRDYFHSPWAVLSFIAAILLLLLTLIGTLFSILSFVSQIS